MKPDRRDPLKNLPRFKNLAVLKDLPLEGSAPWGAAAVVGDCALTARQHSRAYNDDAGGGG